MEVDSLEFRSMNTEAYKQLLLQREQDLLEQTSRLDEEGRDARSAEVEDPIDYVVSTEGKAANFRLSTTAYQQLAQVKDALRRIEEGTYGFCLDCGKEIPAARLDAVPWTPYCAEDQEKHDQESQAEEDQELDSVS
jgi:DnaK suppressor protein